MAISSLRAYITLMQRGWLAMPQRRLGIQYEIKEKGKYRIFRETVNKAPADTTPLVIVVGFRLKAIGRSSVLHYLFQRVCLITTPFWSGLQGFHVKLWMVDSETKNYAGIYQWRGREKALDYLNALVPVLGFFSEVGSVWYLLYDDVELEKFLEKLNA